MPIVDLSIVDLFGGIDIYLFDQLQKRRFPPGLRVLDAGCGSGRNSVFFLRAGYDVFGIDRDRSAVLGMQALARELAPQVSPHNFQIADLEELPFRDGTFDVVLCNAVLHFAADEETFRRMCGELMRVLRPKSFFFARVASDIGIEDRVIPHGSRRFTLPDGTDRFLVNESMLLAETERLGGHLVEPIKTSNVQGMRCMTTWCVEKNG